VRNLLAWIIFGGSFRNKLTAKPKKETLDDDDVFVACAVVLGAMTLPALYERYDSEVDHLVARGVHDLRTHFADMDSGVLRKIPRGAGAAAK
jgi:hypothetical protein